MLMLRVPFVASKVVYYRSIMPTKNTKLYSFILVLADIFVLLAAFTLAYIIRVQIDSRPLVTKVYALEYIQIFAMVLPFWIILFALLGLYNSNTYNNRLVEWSRLAAGAFVGILLLIGWEYVFKEAFFPARLVAVYALIGSFALLVFERESLRWIRSLLFRFGIGVRRVLLIGSSGATIDIARALSKTRRSGYKMVAIAGPHSVKPSADSDIKYFSEVDDALAHLKQDRIDTIIQTSLHTESDRNQSILAVAQSNHVEYSFIPGEAEFYSGKNTTDVFLGYPMISVSQTPLVGWGAIAKRIFDTVVSFLLIVILSPIFLLVMILQKIFNPGPIFYLSKRLSRFDQPVNIIKFRSMSAKYGKKDAAAEFRDMGRDDLAREYEKNRKVDNDPRITWFGNFLRVSSLDELPQLFNVLRGQLSLVGPRPILPQETKLVKKGRTALLHSVKSGITGIWQVSGRNKLSFDERIELELFYAQNWTFWLDIKILFKTIIVVIKKSGAK